MSSNIKIVNDLPVVAIIGRTNVGKSTLFNKLLGKNQALTSKQAGTTRDIRYGECYWRGEKFLLADTAGLDANTQKEVDKESIAFSLKAVKQANLVLFVVDAKDGLMPQDKQFAAVLRKSGQPLILVINKVEKDRDLFNANEFSALRIEHVFPVSAKVGAGVGDMLDYVYEKLKLKSEKTVTPANQSIKIAIIGKPNVGKSSLLNKIIGQERVIVSPLPHTTREAQDLTVDYTDEQGESHLMTFIDTPGIIKKCKINDKLLEESINQSLETIKKSDIVLLLLDASSDISVQDKNLAKIVLDNNKSLIFVANKWDLKEDKDEHSDKTYINYLHGHFPYLTWASVIFLSAKTGFKVERLLQEIIELDNRQNKRINAEDLQTFLKHILKKQPVRKAKGLRPPFLHFMKQLRTKPFVFEIITDQAENIHFSYQRFILNELRQYFDLFGCGIDLTFTERIKKKKHQT